MIHLFIFKFKNEGHREHLHNFSFCVLLYKTSAAESLEGPYVDAYNTGMTGFALGTYDKTEVTCKRCRMTRLFKNPDCWPHSISEENGRKYCVVRNSTSGFLTYYVFVPQVRKWLCHKDDGPALTFALFQASVALSRSL